MPRVNVVLDEDVREELIRLVPARGRSRVINEALRRELLRRKRVQATERLRRLRKKTATLGTAEITQAVRQDRSRPR
jgi:hypothetical protein